MSRIAQPLIYLASALSEPIVRGTLRLTCELQRLHALQIKSWVFRGPPESLRVIEQAKTQLDAEDSELLSTIDKPFTVVCRAPQLFAYPAWKYGGISQEFFERGCEGVLAAWAYLHFRLKSRRRDRWFLSDRQSSLEASRQAKAETIEWLKSHSFSDELRAPFLPAEKSSP